MHDAQREHLGLLLGQALALPVEERAGFIEEASGEDAAIREELASLVAASEPSSRYFDALAEQVGPALAAAADFAGLTTGPVGAGFGTGDVVSHYEIVERVGGGMGVVYRARDVRLVRAVALKFLPPALAADERARERLYAEARAASALDHPNIGTVYEIGDADRGGLFIALAWYEGETLKETLRRGPLPVAEAVEVARQVASALAAAHAAGIVHRDVKPSNIVRTSQGTAKLVDFGIAKMAGTEPTREGWTPGTVAYMSPEQTRGDKVDARTDVWSLGVVLYEMLAGRRPFRGEDDATLIHAIRHDEPESVATLRSDIRPALVAIVETCLEKDPSVRYARADDLLAALGALDDAGSTVERGRIPDRLRHVTAGNRVRAPMLGRGEAVDLSEGGAPDLSAKDSLPRDKMPNPRRKRALVAVVLFALLSGTAAAYVLLRQRSEIVRSPYAGEPAAFAVLPFQISGSGLVEWEEGIAHLLSAALDGAAGIRAVNSRTVLSRWHRELDGGSPADLATVLRVATATGARFALEGSAVSIGQDVRLVARVHDLDHGTAVGTARVEGSLDSPHALVDSLGIEVLRVLFGDNVAELRKVDLAAVTTTSTDALRAFLRGERSYREGRFEDAVEAYEQAVAIDSTFALAYHRLHLTVGWIGAKAHVDPGERLHATSLQSRYGDRARELADRLPERERLLVLGTYRMTRSATDPTRLETTLEEAVARYPRDAEVWYLLAETLLHAGNLIMSPFEIQEMFARATQLDPAFAPYWIHPIEFAFWLYGDGAMAADRIAEYRQASRPGDPYAVGSERTLTRMFGDSLAHAAALDTLRYIATFPIGPPLGPPPGANTVASHPRLLSRTEAGLRVLMEDGVGIPITRTGPELSANLADQGRFTEALEIGRLPGVSASEEWLCLLSKFVLFGYVPSEAVEAAIDNPRPTGTPGAAFCKALLSADLGVRSAFDEQREQLLTLARDADEGTFQRQLENLVRVADVYWIWRQENASAEGVRSLTTQGGRARPLNWRSWLPNWKYWLGEMYREIGQPRKAEQAYLASLNVHTGGRPSAHAWYHLAGIYDELGDEAKARDAWQLVLIAWENADPELQPRVKEARARLAALEQATP